MSSWVGLEGVERKLPQLGPIGVLPERQREGIGDERATLPQGRVVYPPTFD